MHAWTIIMLALAFTASGFAAAAPAKNLPNQPGKIVVEPDQTDIYAIPLDEDADEQQQELYNLEHPKK